MKISPREKQIICMLSLTTPEIAARLIISEKTVKTHIFNLFNKFNTDGRTKIIIEALKKGIVTLEELVI